MFYAFPEETQKINQMMAKSGETGEGTNIHHLLE